MIPNIMNSRVSFGQSEVRQVYANEIAENKEIAMEEADKFKRSNTFTGTNQREGVGNNLNYLA